MLHKKTKAKAKKTKNIKEIYAQLHGIMRGSHTHVIDEDNDDDDDDDQDVYMYPTNMHLDEWDAY